MNLRKIARRRCRDSTMAAAEAEVMTTLVSDLSSIRWSLQKATRAPHLDETLKEDLYKQIQKLDRYLEPEQI